MLKSISINPHFAPVSGFTLLEVVIALTLTALAASCLGLAPAAGIGRAAQADTLFQRSLELDQAMASIQREYVNLPARDSAGLAALSAAILTNQDSQGHSIGDYSAETLLITLPGGVTGLRAELIHPLSPGLQLCRVFCARE